MLPSCLSRPLPGVCTYYRVRCEEVSKAGRTEDERVCGAKAWQDPVGHEINIRSAGGLLWGGPLSQLLPFSFIL